MASRKTPLLTTFLLFVFQLFLSAQTASLPRSTPEAEGVSSEGILQFINAVESSKHELHSMMLLRHGKVVAEGWWNPYGPDLKHTLYSCSKSFTATAIGLAVSEKRLTVDDKVVSFFPNDLPATVSPNLAEMRVKDLLSMSAGQFPEPTFNAISKDSNWVKSFLAAPVVYQPGTKFLYNSLATYMLSAIVQKVTGQKVVDYLKPRLFEPLGISGADWETDPMGINTGGWGLRVKTEDMAKFAQLFLQKGKWNGKQVIPASWVEEASTMKIIQHPDMAQAKRDSSDWEQGYCYQMWRCRNNAYRGDGAYGQFMIVMPDQDAVLAITCETSDMQDEFNLIWKYLFPAIQKGKLSANKTAATALSQKLASLALPQYAKGTSSPGINAISGATFLLSPNDNYLQSMGFLFKGDTCFVTLKDHQNAYKLAFGSGFWVRGETSRKGPSLVALAKNHLVGIPPEKVAGSYQWKDQSTLEFTLRYIESPHTETFSCRFDKTEVLIDYQSSIGEKQPIHGMAQQGRPKPIRLIIRGDDMGFSHSGNEALIQSYKAGIETSIEVIVPSPWFPEAVKLLEQNPGIDVGVHLAITSEWENVKWRPVSDCPSLKNKDGYFYPMVYANKNYRGQSVKENNWTIADIEKEFRAQIEMAVKKIPRISHISSHMGCTNLTDEVKALTKKLAKEYKIDIDLEDYEVKWTGYEGPKNTGEEKVNSFINGLRLLEPGKTYFFVDHPGIDNAELQAIYHVGYENVAADRQGVTDLFTDPTVKAFILQNGIQLIGYKDLATLKK